MSNLIPVNDLQVMAAAVAKSQLFGAKTIDQAMALMLIAQAEGLHPAIAARDYDVIQGRPSKKAEAMLRDFIASGGKVDWHTLTDSKADATFSHPQGGSVRIDWDVKRASTAGLAGKDMWKKYPRQMLRSRCISEGIRTVCPSATSGLLAHEEAQDEAEQKPAPLTRPEPKDMGDAVVVPMLSDVLEKINAAQTDEELDACRDDIRALASSERKVAIDAAKEKDADIQKKKQWTPTPEEAARIAEAEKAEA